MIVQPCQHSIFCFQCLKGLKECPICLVPIKGWNQTKHISMAPIKAFPLSLSLPDAFHEFPLRSRQLNIESASKKSSDNVVASKTKKVSALKVDEESQFDLEDATNSDKEDETLVQWSIDDKNNSLDDVLRSKIPVRRSSARGLQSSPLEECEPQTTKLETVIPIFPKVSRGRPKESSKASTNFAKKQTRMDGPAEDPIVPKKFR